MENELTELVRDVNEQILFLEELGVETLNADWPENKELKFERIETVKSSEKPEKFVPTDSILKSVASLPEILPPEKEKRQSLLEATKLSRLPSLGQRPAFQKFTIEPKENPEMPKNETKPDLTATLFGDVSQNLPDSNESIEDIRAEIGDCRRCELCNGRTKIVHSKGNLQSDLMFVGEAPGADEDAQGAPFVGRAGQLLTKIIEAIGLSREDVFIGNINRCRPPGNRAPLPDETAACKPFLLREIAVVKPKVIVVLGNTAMKNLLDTKEGITKLRGIFQDYYGVKVMPTFHPAYLLRDPSKKREVWEDMKKVRDYLKGDKN